MNSDHPRVIALVGNVNSLSTWSGTAFHFFKAAKQTGFAEHPLNIDLSREKLPRILWNLKELMQGRKGGYQYSPFFLSRIESQIPKELLNSNFLTFNQHFPRFRTLQTHGGSLSHYLDAPFIALANGQGLDIRLPRRTKEAAIRVERENLENSQRIITMARWAADVIRATYDVERLHTVLPGANFDLPSNWEFRNPEQKTSEAYDLVLGFIGKDWSRKGLPLLLEIQKQLQSRGYKILIRAIGYAPESFKNYPDLEYSGFIDKYHHSDQFAQFLSSCDIGCLFSQREALGISTLEFLHAGIPVAGYFHEGLADTLPQSASLRFHLKDSIQTISDGFEQFIIDSKTRQSMNKRAIEISPLLTWERCVSDLQKIWHDPTYTPLRLWEL